MKTNLLLAILVLFIGLTKVKSQCTPDVSCVSTYCPTELPQACIDSVYNQSITFNVPALVKIPFNGSFINVTVDTAKIKKIENQPSCFTYSTTPADYFKGGSIGCFNLYGTPTLVDIGSYNLKITIHLAGKTKVFGMDQPVTYDSVLIEPVNIIDCAVGIEKKTVQSFDVFQNVPNPFIAKTEIGYTSAQADNIEFSVFNIIGEKLYSEKLKAVTGANKIIFESKILSSGIYFYKISNGVRTSTHRMIISTN